MNAIASLTSAFNILSLEKHEFCKFSNNYHEFFYVNNNNTERTSKKNETLSTTHVTLHNKQMLISMQPQTATVTHLATFRFA